MRHTVARGDLVELVGFDVTREQDDVRLTWATATEVNADEFIIQRKPYLLY